MTVSGELFAHAHPNVPRRRILIVNLLTDPGYQLYTANNGANAIERLEREHFGLVVTDMVMPEANGLDALLSPKHL